MASGALATSPSSASSSSFWPLPATPATPKISPLRTEKLMSSSEVPKWPAAGSERWLTTKAGSPKLCSLALTMSLRSPPIIFSAIEREVSTLGSQVSTTLPPRKIVALSHNAFISLSLCEM